MLREDHEQDKLVGILVFVTILYENPCQLPGDKKWSNDTTQPMTPLNLVCINFITSHPSISKLGLGAIHKGRPQNVTGF